MYQQERIKKINLLDINNSLEFVEGIKNLCKVIDATKNLIDFFDDPLKKIIQETTHSIVEDLVKYIFKNTSLKKYEGIADYLSIGINCALDLFLFRLKNLEGRKLDDSYFREMLDLADKINQKKELL